MTTNISTEYTTPEIDIRKLLQTVLQSKRILAFVTITTMILTVLIGWSMGGYKSVGYFQFDMSIPDYKKLQSAIAAPGRWDDFLSARRKADVSELTNIKYALTDQKHISNLIAPIYPFTKAELKDLPESAKKNTTTTGISALKISFKANTQEEAQKAVLILGDFLRDTAILMNYKDNVPTTYTDYFSTQRKFENNVIETKYQLEQMQIRKADMQKILRDYPESGKSDSRQLVSISEGSARYLSPVTQLVAIETSMAEQTQSLPKIMRDQRINDIYLRYYKKVLGLLEKSSSGETFLRVLPTLRDTLNLNLEDDVEKSVYNSIALDNLNAQAQYFEKMRFIAEPTKSFLRSPSLSLMAIFGLLLGAFLGCGYILISDALKKPLHTPASFKLAA